MDASARRRRDSGFTLVEVIVAFALFAVMATALLVVVSTSQKLTQEDAARVVAQNLASRELEITRDTFTGITRGPAKVATNRVENPNPLPDGTTGGPLMVDGVAYTVVRQAQWASIGEAGSKCDDGSSAELAYLRVKVEVSWPRLGSRPPVTMETIITPSKGTYTASTGHIGFRVIDRQGEPREGVEVLAKKGATTRSGRTADDGCVLFDQLEPGTYTLTLATAGEVGPSGSPTVTRTVPVEAGQLWRGSQEYDRAATISAVLTPAEGFSLPQEVEKIPVTLGNSALLPNGRRAVAGTNTTRLLTNLWPYPSGYQLWAGGCTDSDPGDAKGAAVDADPGTTTAAVVNVPPVEITTSGTNQVITATHAADSTCSSAVTMRLGTTTGATLRTSLPYGTWAVSRQGSSASTSVIVGSPVQSGSDAAGAAPVTRVTIP